MNSTQIDYSFQTKANQTALRQGFRDGIPIGLGYFAVSFSLGIVARRAGLTPFQGFLASALCSASAGEYAGFTLIAAMGTFLEIAVITFITNARYMLMSCALSQKADPGLPLRHRLLTSFYITDELFAISIARPGCLNPYYMYGAILVAVPCWAFGTAFGVIAGDLLPLRLVGLVVLSFTASFCAAYLPIISDISDGTRTILLTVVISAAAAILFPKSQTKEESNT